MTEKALSIPTLNRRVQIRPQAYQPTGTDRRIGAPSPPGQAAAFEDRAARVIHKARRRWLDLGHASPVARVFAYPRERLAARLGWAPG